MQFVCFRSCCSCFFNSMVPYLCAPMLVPTFNGPVTNSEGGLTLGTSTTRSTHVSLDCSMNLQHSSYCLQTCTTCSFKSHSEYTFSHKRYRRCLSYSPTQVHKLLLNLRSSHSCPQKSHLLTPRTRMLRLRAQRRLVSCLIPMVSTLRRWLQSKKRSPRVDFPKCV